MSFAVDETRPCLRDTAQELAVWQGQVDRDTRVFAEISLTVSDVFPDLKGLCQEQLRAVMEEERRTISADYSFDRSIYRASAPADAPAVNQIDPQWAVFRFFQYRMQSAFRMFARY